MALDDVEHGLQDDGEGAQRGVENGLGTGPGAGVSRRFFLKAVGGAGLGTVALPASGLLGAPEQAGGAATGGSGADGVKVSKGQVPISLRVNGKERQLTVETRTTLLDALRDKLDLTGSKLICDRGTCGGCTVELDGKIVTSCLVLAIDAVGREIRTIEGLAQGEGAGAKLHPVQQAFIECDALQCGFCTPGFVMATAAVLKAKPKATMDEIKEGISGNICRCGTYNHIFDAAERAQGMMSG